MQNDSQLLIDAMEFASWKHRFQRRKQGEAYITHPVAVCKILRDAGITDPEILAGALLHDTVEDTDATFEEIEQKFGSQVALYVREATDDKDLDKCTRKKTQVEKVKNASFGGKMIKVGDKIHNVSCLINEIPCPFEPYTAAQGYIVWCKKVVDQARGLNKQLDERFDALLSMKIQMKDGSIYPAFPEGDFEKNLESYYESVKPK